MDKARITLRQILPIIGIGGEMVDIMIHTKERQTPMKMDSNSVEELLSEQVLDSEVSYITAKGERLYINVVVKEQKNA